jgi:hypothetical protein
VSKNTRAKLSLSAPSKEADADTTAKPAAKRRGELKYPQPSREGTKLIAGHFPKAVWEEFGMIGLRLDRTTQDMLGEALTDFINKYRSSK